MYNYATQITYSAICRELLEKYKDKQNEQKNQEENADEELYDENDIRDMCFSLYQVELAKTFSYSSVEDMIQDATTWLEYATTVVQPLLDKRNNQNKNKNNQQNQNDDKRIFTIMCFSEDVFDKTHACLQQWHQNNGEIPLDTLAEWNQAIQQLNN